jgi:hypothetical protein
MCSAMVLAGLHFATLGALTGKLIDDNNNPLTGADVFLVNQNMHDSTDAAGAFSFSGMSVRRTGALAQRHFLSPQLSDNVIYFTLGKSGIVEYDIYSVKGVCVYRYRNTLDQGDHFLSIAKNSSWLAGGIYVISFRTEGLVKTFKYNSFCRNNFKGVIAPSEKQNEPKAPALHKAKDAPLTIDTLIITKVVGDVTSKRKIRVYDYGDNINSSKYVANGMQMVILDPSNDNDGDGLTNFEERYVYFTDAELADCDGDGVTDYEEIKNNTNPLIADFPDISFVANNYPVITATYSKSIGSSNEKDISTGGEYSNTSDYSSQQQVNATASIAVMLGAEASIGKESGFKVSGSITTTIGAGFTQTWTSDQSTSMSKNWSEAQNTATSNDVTITGGTISMDVTLINNSGQDFTLVDPKLRLTSTGSTISTAIGELSVTGGSTDIYVSSKPGSNTTLRTFTTTINNPDLLDEIARQSSGLVAQLTNISFRTSLGGIDTIMTNVYKRTSQVIVDFGTASSNKVIKKRVASRCRYNDFYTSYLDRYLPATLKQVLEMAGVKPVLGTDTNGNYGITAIDSLKNGALPKGVWSVVCQMGDSLEVFSTSLGSYDPATVQVGQADVLTCLYDADQDGDGVSDRLEAVLGTDPKKIDTDGDGISDRDEFMGWRRATDPPGVLWKTNPKLKDTDGDGLNDFEDPDPLTPLVSPLDSFVSFSRITLTPFQGAAWVDSMQITDSNTAVAVNQIFRGNTAISMKFIHPVYSVTVICSTGTNPKDTTRIFTPDNTGAYNDTVDMPLGNNQMQIIAVSKNGTSTKKVILGGISRRLAMVTDTVSQFAVTKPSQNLTWKAMNITIDFDKIKAMDSRIAQVYLLRTQTFAAPSGNGAIDAIKTANDLGDAGNGTLNLQVGNTVTGKDGNQNSFTVVRILDQTTSTFTDSTLQRDYYYAYFIATSNESGTMHFFTAAPTLSGRDAQVDQAFVIDSITYNIHYDDVSINYDTKIQTRIIVSDAFGSLNWDSQYKNSENWGYTGTNVHLAVPMGVTIPYQNAYQKVSFSKADFGNGAEFQQNYFNTWYPMFTLTAYFIDYMITHPVKYLSLAVSASVASDFSTHGANKYTYAYANGIYHFSNQHTIYWHYANGDFSNTGF